MSGTATAASATTAADPRRPGKVVRYRGQTVIDKQFQDDLTPDYLNFIGMICSMCGLMLKLKWCAWAAIFASFISFSNSSNNRASSSGNGSSSQDDNKQIMSSFILSVSSIFMSYLQNPQPMVLPWSSPAPPPSS